MVKCRKCSKPAVINMRQHKLALCGEHFLEWIPAQTQRFIEKYKMFGPRDTILVAVSGGKDSLSLWDALLRLDYEAQGLYIDLGILEEGYSSNSLAKVDRFVEKREGVRLKVVGVAEEYGKSILQLARGRPGQKTCSLCGLVKRYIMNEAALEEGAILATGHNLDDEAAVLLQNVLHWQTGYLFRQAPVLPATHPRLARKVKPFFRFYERETAAYAILRGIDYIYEECPFARGATTIFYKELLNRLEERSRGAKLQFYLSFLRAREKGFFLRRLTPEDAERISPVAEGLELGECERCGQPTTAPGLCAFCRLWKVAEAEVR
jgi:uncharacterized protein (TIGR00269 family)